MSVEPTERDRQPGDDGPARFRRHCVLMNNGVWMPLVGIGICKGDAAAVERLVEAAVSAGYRHIDTSHAAHNEAAVGAALRRVIAAGQVRREELFVVTKLPCEGNRRDKVRKYLRSSLKKLQMPFVDLYLVHFPVYERAFKKSHRHHDAQRQRSDLPPVLDASPDSPTSEEESATAVDETDILDTWRGMEDAANMGMTRSIGLCNFNKEQVTRILTMATIRPAALQVECHAYLNQDDLLQFCKEHSICLTAYAPLGSPRAARHGAAASCKEEKPREEQNHSDLMQHELLRKIADTYKKTPAQVFDFELSEADVKILTGLNRNMRLYTYNIYGLPNRAEYPFK
ncbi:aldo-keto reductase family 1 member C1-like isoform X2 [Dermacentor andersoni]|uniref:aldo-keto reductase family 1 member C1-like isoform X2 n=1 Tax=Dermacentor andersoni TaxID=34620 RepID=UPI003B3B8AC3